MVWGHNEGAQEASEAAWVTPILFLEKQEVGGAGRRGRGKAGGLRESWRACLSTIQEPSWGRGWIGEQGWTDRKTDQCEKEPHATEGGK